MTGKKTEIKITEIKICKLQKCWLWALLLEIHLCSEVAFSYPKKLCADISSGICTNLHDCD